MRWAILLVALCSCSRYHHDALQPEPAYSLTVFVAAKHLNYANFYTLCRSMQSSKSGYVGHAWIHLHGHRNGYPFDWTGGLSGELGTLKPAYFRGVMDYIEAGDENPVRYLWSCLDDGFFQQGSGGHKPTYAVRFDITKEQCEKIAYFIQTFDFTSYALTGWQCASFAAKIAELAGYQLASAVTVPIKQRTRFAGRRMILWRDPTYSTITFPSPDILEKSLKEAVSKGQGQRL